MVLKKYDITNAPDTTEDNSGTGWDLGPGTLAAVLVPGQTSPQATEYKEAIKG